MGIKFYQVITIYIYIYIYILYIHGTLMLNYSNKTHRLTLEIL